MPLETSLILVIWPVTVVPAGTTSVELRHRFDDVSADELTYFVGSELPYKCDLNGHALGNNQEDHLSRRR